MIKMFPFLEPLTERQYKIYHKQLLQKLNLVLNTQQHMCRRNENNSIEESTLPDFPLTSSE